VTAGLKEATLIVHPARWANPRWRWWTATT